MKKMKGLFMNKTVITLGVIIVVIIGCFGLFRWSENNNQTTSTDDANDTIVPDIQSISQNETFTLDVRGKSIATLSQPSGFVVEDLTSRIGEQYDGVEVVSVYRIISAQDKIDLETSEGGREGPPTINILVFANPNNLSPREWFDATPSYSNKDFLLGNLNNNETVDGIDAIRYLADGLYRSDNVIVANNNYTIQFNGFFHEEGDALHQTFKELIESVNFLSTK